MGFRGGISEYKAVHFILRWIGGFQPFSNGFEVDPEICVSAKHLTDRLRPFETGFRTPQSALVQSEPVQGRAGQGF